MIRDELLALWMEDEGFRSKPYLCPAGKLTIGFGRNLEDVGITVDEAKMLAISDLEASYSELYHTFPWFSKLNEARQDALTNMNANLGLPRFLGFKKMIAALNEGDFEKAADEMLDSKWEKQVGRRAYRLSSMIRLGQYLHSENGGKKNG